MSVKSWFSTLLLLCWVASNQAINADDAIPRGKKKTSFEISQYSDFINHELSRPKPACSLAEMGISSRRVEGQLVDHQSQPISGVALAIVEPIGFSGHCYFDNFDTTDQQGRFVVDGTVDKTRLVFRLPSGPIWPFPLNPDDRLIRVTWPKPAKVTLRVSSELAQPGLSVSIQTQDYWSGMQVLRHSAELDQGGVAVFDNVIPGHYYVTTKKTITVADNSHLRAIEIANFTIASDEELTVPCGNNGVTEITGTYVTQPNPLAGNLAAYVTIERVKRDYLHSPPTADILKFDADGKFRSRPLSEGHYLIRYLAKGTGRGRFGVVGDTVIRTWQAQVDAMSDTIDVEAIEQPSEAGKFVVSLLQQAVAAGSRQPSSFATVVKQSDVRGGAEVMMLRMMSDPNSPYEWRRVIPGIL